MRITKSHLSFIYLTVALATVLLFNSCTDNSDQIVNNTKAVEAFNVEELINQPNLNDSNLKETVIVVEGFVEEINDLNKRQTILLRGKNDIKTSVICDMQKGQTDQIRNLKRGEPTIIKGILKGSLNDVILLNCVIVNNNTNQ